MAGFASNLLDAWIIRLLPINLGDVLDVGCGQAPYLRFYEKFSRSVILADIYELDKTTNRPELYVQADATLPLPFHNEQFDCVIATELIEHLPRPHSFLTEVYRILKPGGCLLLSAPFSYPIHEAPRDYFRYTHYGLKFLIESSRFELSEISTIGSLNAVLWDILSKGMNTILNGKLVDYVNLKMAHFFSKKSGTVEFNAEKLSKSSRWALGYVLVAKKPL
jgi:SAM-dependent methyltransferase